MKEALDPLPDEKDAFYHEMKSMELYVIMRVGGADHEGVLYQVKRRT